MTTTAVELQLCSGTLTTEIRLYTQYSAYRLQLYTYVLYDLSIVLLGPEYNASCFQDVSSPYSSATGPGGKTEQM